MRAEDLRVIGVSQLAEKLGVTADGGAPQRQASPHTLARPDLYFLWLGGLVIGSSLNSTKTTGRRKEVENQKNIIPGIMR